MVIKINKKSLFVAMSIIILILSAAMAYLLPNIRIISYIDDIIPLIFCAPIVKAVLNKKYKKDEKCIIIALALTGFIGLLSNLMSGLVSNFSYIFLDAYSILKIFFIYLGIRALFDYKKERINLFISYIEKPAKIFIVLSFIFAIFNLFGIVEMSEGSRFGFKKYCFIFGNASQFGVYLGCMMAFLFMSEKKIRFFEILCLITMLLTFKGMSLIIIFCYIGLNVYVRNKDKIKIWHIVMVGIVLMFLLRYQIITYLLNETAPRAILLKYGFVTANTYFPFGAGFGSYGSNIAAVHYSPLYYLYGFSNRKSLVYGEQTALLDCYIGMIAGQFGYFGVILFCVIFALIGFKLLKRTSGKIKERNIVIACFACICGMAVMAGSIKTIPGELLFAVIAIYVSKTTCFTREDNI